MAIGTALPIMGVSAGSIGQNLIARTIITPVVSVVKKESATVEGFVELEINEVTNNQVTVTVKKIVSPAEVYRQQMRLIE